MFEYTMRYFFLLFVFHLFSLFAEPCHLILIRHGETVALANNIYHDDSPLNERGQRQAQAIVEQLRAIPIDALYSSPLRRALQTAEPLSFQRALLVHTYDALRERSHGSLEGHPVAEVIGYDGFDRYYHPRGMEDLRFKLVPDAESFEESTLRFSQCLAQIGSDHPGQTVVIFSHAGLMNGGMISLTHCFDQPQIPNGSFLHLTFDNGQLVLLSNRF
jgi:broad specificity phosphatase PhoE